MAPQEGAFVGRSDHNVVACRQDIGFDPLSQFRKWATRFSSRLLGATKGHWVKEYWNGRRRAHAHGYGARYPVLGMNHLGRGGNFHEFGGQSGEDIDIHRGFLARSVASLSRLEPMYAAPRTEPFKPRLRRRVELRYIGDVKSLSDEPPAEIENETLSAAKAALAWWIKWIVDQRNNPNPVLHNS